VANISSAIPSPTAIRWCCSPPILKVKVGRWDSSLAIGDALSGNGRSRPFSACALSYHRLNVRRVITALAASEARTYLLNFAMFAVLLNQRDQKQSVLVTASSARDVEHALERMIVAQRARRPVALDHVGGPSGAAMRKFISTRRCPTVPH
jgi:hypothetical protein